MKTIIAHIHLINGPVITLDEFDTIRLKNELDKEISVISLNGLDGGEEGVEGYSIPLTSIKYVKYVKKQEE